MTAPKPPSKKAPAKRAPKATTKATPPDTPEPTGIGPIRPQGGRPAKGADRAHIEMRRAKVAKMDLDGMSLNQMADAVKVDKHTVADDLKAVHADRRARAAGVDLQSYREREVERLEAARLDLMTELEGVADLMSDEKRPRLIKAVDDRVRIHRELLKISGRLSKLLGLDAPQQVMLSGEVRGTLATGLASSDLAGLLTDGTGIDDDMGAG